MSTPPKQTPPSWIKPIADLSLEQRQDNSREQAQRLRLAGMLKPVGPRPKAKGERAKLEHT
jgi:hypothetical protein